MPRFALSGIFLIGASLVLLAGATEGPRAGSVARDAWTVGMAWLSGAVSSSIDAGRQALRHVPEKAGPPSGLASPPATQRTTGPPAATPSARATSASPSGASSPAVLTPRSNVASPREAAAPPGAPTTAAASRYPGDTPRAEVNDLRNQVTRSQMEIASLAVERDRARQELEALRQQQPTQAAAPLESKALEKIAASNVSPSEAPAAPTPRPNATSAREAAAPPRAPMTAAGSRDPGDTPRAEVNDLRNQVKRSQTELASLAAERDRARQELEALRQQQQTQAAASSESKALEKIAASNASPRSPVTASRGIRARQHRHPTAVYRPVRTPSYAPARFSSEGLY
jgi:hypothetical protein